MGSSLMYNKETVILHFNFNTSILYNLSEPMLLFKNISYRNFPKFSDRQVWANSADPDQTAPRGAV